MKFFLVCLLALCPSCSTSSAIVSKLGDESGLGRRASLALARSSAGSTEDPLLGAVLFGEEYLDGTVKRLSATLTRSNAELAALQASLNQWQAPVAALSTSAHYNLGVVNGNAATIAKAGANLTALTATGGKLSVTLARLVATNGTAASLSTALSGGSKVAAPPTGNLSQRIFKANETLLINGTVLSSRLKDLGSLVARLNHNVSYTAGRMMRNIIDNELAKAPLKLATEVQHIIDAKMCTSNCSSAFEHCCLFKTSSPGGLLKEDNAYTFCREGLNHGNNTNMTSHGCLPFCQDTDEMYSRKR